MPPWCGQSRRGIAQRHFSVVSSVSLLCRPGIINREGEVGIYCQIPGTLETKCNDGTSEGCLAVQKTSSIYKPYFWGGISRKQHHSLIELEKLCKMWAHFVLPLLNEAAFPCHPQKVCFCFISTYFSFQYAFPRWAIFYTSQCCRASWRVFTAWRRTAFLDGSADISSCQIHFMQSRCKHVV